MNIGGNKLFKKKNKKRKRPADQSNDENKRKVKFNLQ